MAGSQSPLVKWTVISAVLQIVLVVVGHFSPGVLKMVPIIGTLIPLIVGLFYAVAAKISWGNASWGGAVAGGVGALIGAVVNVALGDGGPEPAKTVMIATVASLVAGLIGGLIGHAVAGRKG
jgi:hypothetical protein